MIGSTPADPPVLPEGVVVAQQVRRVRMAGSTRRWTAKDNAVLGVMLSVPAGMITFGVSGATGQWLWAILTVPVMVLLSVTIGWVARVGARSVVLVRVSTVTGLIAAAVAGVALIYFGIAVGVDAPVCDPEVSRCVVVINGVARGESDQSVGSQHLGNLLLSLVAIVPGLTILFWTVRGAAAFARRLAGERGRRFEE
jgi:hypothetical protein